jgi:sulfatase modifying factor 1
MNEFVLINGNSQFQSVLQGNGTPVNVKSFQMQQHPVTNAEFLQFVIAHPEWQRGSVASLFANGEYLGHWQAATSLGEQARPDQPVTRISWFAAQAYCESIQARLPNWYEWELVGAASESMNDARNNDVWKQRILDWYSKPVATTIETVMRDKPNAYHVYDMHGLIWEWVLDFNALMDSNEAQKFCGSGALNFQQKENFAILMRVAMLSSLHARDTLHSLGFRCVRDNLTVPHEVR